MTLQIPITGIDSSWRVPGPYLELLFGQGPASAAVGAREIVIAMPKASTGTWTAATLYRITNEKDAEDGAGAGSPLHRAARKILQLNKDVKLWGLPVAETSGGSPIAATWTNTITMSSGSNPTARGVATVTVCGEECSYGYSTSDTVTTIAAGLKAAVNAKPWLPVSADNSSGVLTLTVKVKGVNGGTATVPCISARAAVTTGTNVVATASGAHLGTGVAGAEGSTTEHANLATALAAIDNVRKYYIVTSDTTATGLGHVKTHITNKSEPRRGLRSVGIAAYPGTLANCTTIANGLNYERVQVNWIENPDNDPAEIAGAIAAIRAKWEALDATKNLSMYGLSGILNNAYTTSDWPSDSDLNDAINDGIAPIKSSDAGPVFVMNVNTRSKNSAGTQDDFRATECHRVSGADLFADRVLADWNLNWAGLKLEDDEVLADGKPNPNQRSRAGVVRPSIYKPHFIKLIQDFYDEGHTQSLTAMKESVRVVKTGSRLEIGSNVHIIDHNLIGTFRLAEVSTG